MTGINEKKTLTIVMLLTLGRTITSSKKTNDYDYTLYMYNAKKKTHIANNATYRKKIEYSYYYVDLSCRHYFVLICKQKARQPKTKYNKHCLLLLYY